MIRFLIFLFIFCCFTLLCPVIAKLIMSLVLIKFLADIFFLRKRIQIASDICKSVMRLRSYKILRKRIFRVINSEFEKSSSFKAYIKYREFVYLILHDQRTKSNRAEIVNPIKPILKVLTYKMFQVIYQSFKYSILSFSHIL